MQHDDGLIIEPSLGPIRAEIRRVSLASERRHITLKAMERAFAVLRSRGPAWDDTKSLEGQQDWPAHAQFMDALFDQRFATRDALLILRASSAAEIVERLASDPWTANGLLITKQISAWQLRLGSLG